MRLLVPRTLRYKRAVEWLWICVGGGVGTGLRYGLARLAARLESESWWWPLGTFGANVLGSFLLGLLFVWGEGRELFGHDARRLLGVGVLGGFTTYSSFNLETLRLAEELQYGRAALYVLVTVGTCLLAGVAGLGVGRALRGG